MLGKGEAWQVVYDGSCRLCRASQKLLARRLRRVPVAFVDGNQLGLAPEDFVALRLQTPQGRSLTGFGAIVTLLAEDSRHGFLWRLLLKPPLSWLGEAAYRLVARHRWVLGRKKGTHL